jgi:hypothetical protein
MVCGNSRSSGNYQLLVIMRDFAGENMSHEIQEFFTDKGVKSYFSTPYEPWQDGLGEAGIKSVLLLARTKMAESRLEGTGSLPSTMESNAEMSPSNIVWVRHHMHDYME